MNKEFVPYELAVKLKELGFVDECMAYYTISLTEVEHKEDGTTGPFGWKKGEVFFEKRFFKNNSQGIDGSNENWLEVGAPLYQQAFRFFREEYNLFCEIQIDRTTEPKFCFDIFQYEHFGNYEKIEVKEWYLYRTYEAAELACLDKLIELVENKK